MIDPQLPPVDLKLAREILGLRPDCRRTFEAWNPCLGIDHQEHFFLANGLPPCPVRQGGTWDKFLQRHASSHWKMDFISQKVLNLRGIREVFVIAFLHVHTGAPTSLQPPNTRTKRGLWSRLNRSWTKLARAALGVRYIIHDLDSKFSQAVDQTLRRQRPKIVKIAFKAHRMQVHVERFIETLRNEELDHFIIFGSRHLDSLLKHFWPITVILAHQGKNNQLLAKAKSHRKTEPPATISVAKVRCEQKLGGLLKSYRWAA
jgi:putative transposase